MESLGKGASLVCGLNNCAFGADIGSGASHLAVGATVGDFGLSRVSRGTGLSGAAELGLSLSIDFGLCACPSCRSWINEGVGPPCDHPPADKPARLFAVFRPNRWPSGESAPWRLRGRGAWTGALGGAAPRLEGDFPRFAGHSALALSFPIPITQDNLGAPCLAP